MEGQIEGRAERQNNMKASQRVFDLICNIAAAEMRRKLRFLREQNGPTDRRTDGRTDGQNLL